MTEVRSKNFARSGAEIAENGKAQNHIEGQHLGEYTYI